VPSEYPATSQGRPLHRQLQQAHSASITVGVLGSSPCTAVAPTNLCNKGSRQKPPTGLRLPVHTTTREHDGGGVGARARPHTCGLWSAARHRRLRSGLSAVVLAAPARGEEARCSLEKLVEDGEQLRQVRQEQHSAQRLLDERLHRDAALGQVTQRQVHCQQRVTDPAPRGGRFNSASSHRGLNPITGR
jgi:hypothetical protein